MASRKASASSYQPNKSFFTLSDQEILTKIYATHVYDNEKLDVESLLIIAENILNRATLAVDNALLGTQATTEQWEEKTPKASFSPPLCTLKHISCEMNCKAGPSDEIAQETTMSILEKLSSYSWDAKAVLTLASFALEYGEFCALAQIQISDQLVNSVRNLKRVPVLLKHAILQKHQQAFVDLNKVIKATLEVIKCIFELEKLSNYDTKVLSHIEVDVYWAIITIVASTTQLSCIFSDEDKKQELNHYAVKLNVILPKLKNQIAICKEQREETEAYQKLVKLFRTSMQITEVIKGLIDPTNKMQPLNDWSTKKLMHVEIDVLKTKNVLLIISDLDISDADISILRSISDKIGKESRYKIVWIPFMEKWTEDQKNKFENLQSDLPGYIARYNLKIASCRFIKEQWHFKGKPLLVVLNSQGQVECENAMHMIRVYGVESFPFTRGAEETLLKEKCWIEFATIHIKKEIPRWIKERKYIFLYGGEEKWIQQFTEKATLVLNDNLLKEKGISIELVAVEKEKERFWTSIESMFISKAQWKTETDDVGQEIQNLLSYKNESAWTVFTKGSSVLVSVSGTTVLKALEDFDNWKVHLPEKDFETAFKESHDRFVETEMLHICSRIDIPLTTGITTETMKCSHCQAIMETYMSFKCCHKVGAAST